MKALFRVVLVRQVSEIQVHRTKPKEEQSRLDMNAVCAQPAGAIQFRSVTVIKLAAALTSLTHNRPGEWLDYEIFGSSATRVTVR